MTHVSLKDPVTALRFSIATKHNVDDAMRTCVSTHVRFTGTLTFDVRSHKTNELVLQKHLEDFVVDAWVFGVWQGGREMTGYDVKKRLIGEYVDKYETISNLMAYQRLGDPKENRVGMYMLRGIRTEDEDEVTKMPPFHDSAVVEFLCDHVYDLVHGSGRRGKFVPTTLVYPPKAPAAPAASEGAKRTRDDDAKEDARAHKRIKESEETAAMEEAKCTRDDNDPSEH